MYESNPIKEVIAIVAMMTVFVIWLVVLIISSVLTQIIAWLPLLILATGISVAAIIWAIRTGRKQPETKVIERQVIYIVSADKRREVWQAITDSRPDAILLPDNGKVEAGK